MSTELKTDDDKTSYALGINMAFSLFQVPTKLNYEAAILGFTDALRQDDLKISQEDAQALLMAFQQKLQDMETEVDAELAEKNLAEQEAFLGENKSAHGVVTTDSGLQYKVISEGDGPKPSETDTVSVHYTGTLLDGTVFDSSVARGEPAEFPVNRVIRGWSEALQLMSVGSKYTLYIPSDLGYGTNGVGQDIGPNALLNFEVELLEIV